MKKLSFILIACFCFLSLTSCSKLSIQKAEEITPKDAPPQRGLSMKQIDSLSAQLNYHFAKKNAVDRESLIDTNSVKGLLASK